jgi:ADP-dependent phosphofructokinase/glucokinase
MPASAKSTQQVISFSSIAAAVAMLLGILKACDEAQDQKAAAHVKFAAEQVRCAKEIEQLNEDWHKRWEAAGK